MALRDAAPARRLTLRSIARLAGSSPAAAGPALRKAGWQDLAASAGSLDPLSWPGPGTCKPRPLRRTG